MVTINREELSMKLEIELVPSTAWEKNLRNEIPSKEWDKIRKQSYADAGNRDPGSENDC